MLIFLARLKDFIFVPSVSTFAASDYVWVVCATRLFCLHPHHVPEKTFFAMSKPIVVIFTADSSSVKGLFYSSTLAHHDAALKRGGVHTITLQFTRSTIVRSLQFIRLTGWIPTKKS
jgi:hypothetical protein